MTRNSLDMSAQAWDLELGMSDLAFDEQSALEERSLLVSENRMTPTSWNRLKGREMRVYSGHLGMIG